MCKANRAPWKHPRGRAWKFCGASVQNCQSECCDTRLHAIHRLGNSKIVIVKLVNRLDTFKILRNKKKLHELPRGGNKSLEQRKFMLMNPCVPIPNSYLASGWLLLILQTSDEASAAEWETGADEWETSADKWETSADEWRHMRDQCRRMRHKWER